MQSSLALVARNCNYVTLVETVMTKFALDPTKVAVSLKYILYEDLPPIRIKNDSNVLSYVLLKDMEREPAKYPIIIDVVEAEIDNTTITVPVNAHSSGEMFTLQDVALEICEASNEKNGSHS
ncbi:Hypothetical predicted protein [Olea europaea subsp. europaea]|uniref:Uncharacterized protein n=1 Tax=Olea europaea subsp. europaea TaxID=158383 RepID=A0A8S0QU03_OLEEU|nr:Hypothetical predicted protein [Olea europaea subsp. europaea]